MPRPLPRIYSTQPYQYDPVPKRDERFPDPYNMGVNAEVFLYNTAFAPEPKTLMMFYKRLREIDVPEMMASIIAETPGLDFFVPVDPSTGEPVGVAENLRPAAAQATK